MDFRVQPDAPPYLSPGDWRSQLPPDSRHRIIQTITDALKRSLVLLESGQPGMHEIKQVAIELEEKFYNAAANQSDYLRDTSLSMLTPEDVPQLSMSTPTMASVFLFETESNNWIQARQEQLPDDMDASDWRSHLHPNHRHQTVNKMFEILRRHLLLPDQQGLHELRNIAGSFIQKMYNSATSQSDYIKKVFVKMLILELLHQN